MCCVRHACMPLTAAGPKSLLPEQLEKVAAEQQILSELAALGAQP